MKGKDAFGQGKRKNMREMKKAALLEEMIKVKEEVVQLRKTKTNDIY